MGQIDVGNIQEERYPTFRADDVPFRITYAEWTARWWRWALSLSTRDNPVCDITGENSAHGQAGDVWFLAGTLGGKVERSCKVPSEKAILFPISAHLSSYSEFPYLKTDNELIAFSKADIDKVTTLLVTIDGIKFRESDLQRYRVQSPPFDVKYPEDNMFGAPSGTTRAVSDGYWIFLKPLPKGKHEIYFMGSCNTDALRTEVHYHVRLDRNSKVY